MSLALLHYRCAIKPLFSAFTICRRRVPEGVTEHFTLEEYRLKKLEVAAMLFRTKYRGVFPVPDLKSLALYLPKAAHHWQNCHAYQFLGLRNR